MIIKEEIQRATPLVDRVNAAIRDNPLAAGLIGAGVAWMLFGAKGLGAVGGLLKSAGGTVVTGAKGIASATATAGSNLAKAGSTAASTMKGAVTEVAESAASIVPDQPNIESPPVADALSDAGTAVSERVQAVASAGRVYGAAIRSRLSDSFDKQPLLLGAIGVAIGAGIASTFATTNAESEWMGQAGTGAREKLKDAVDEAKQRGRRVLSDVQEEATRQDLTIDAAKDAATAVAGKVQNVAAIARESVAQRFR